jgi:hypothetical protein
MAGKKSKYGMKGGKNTKYGMSGGKNTKYGMKGGREPKATEMGAESNKQYVKRMFGAGMTTRITNDMPMENKGYQAGRKVEAMGKKPMRSKGGMQGGKNTKYAMKGGKS